MKPIFETERQFLQEELNVVIPRFCWRTPGNEIYFDAIDFETGRNPFLKFKVIEGQFLQVVSYQKDLILDENYIYQDTIKGIQLVPVKTWKQEYLDHKKSILAKKKESLKEGKAFLKRFPKAEIRLGVSGGKDSTLTDVLLKELMPSLKRDFYTDYFNPSNDTADTYKYIKHTANFHNLEIHNPKIGIHKWLSEEKNNYLPSRTARTCCEKFKEGALIQDLDAQKEYVLVVGVRKSESNSRSYYQFDLNQSVLDTKGPSYLNMPLNFHRLALIVNWTDTEVWLYLMYHDIAFNPMYVKGFNRVGCLVCYNQTDYIDILIRKYYALQWSKWERTIGANYDTYRIERLNWTKEEWINGRWKNGTSKEYDYITRKATPERVSEVARIKNISTSIAWKFFKRTCSCCKTKSGNPKFLNSTEVSMNLKFFGRQEQLSVEQELSRRFLCKSCMCKELKWTQKEYTAKVESFMDNGCDLFLNSELSQTYA